MPRILFTKTGDAVWISHLDLMRVFQRAFKRAGLPLTHTQGYNPRPSVSIALPLSVGVESQCELLDFELDGESVPCEQITQRLNAVLVPGVQVLQTYENGNKLKELSLLRVKLTMEYDHGVPAEAGEGIQNLFQRATLTVEKKGKNGPVQQDIIPMIRSFELRQSDANTMVMDALICCQNPTLNPAQMVAAITNYLPQYAPDFTKCRRMEIFTDQEKQFR
jgi:radical SAM-linked protein